MVMSTDSKFRVQCYIRADLYSFLSDFANRINKPIRNRDISEVLEILLDLQDENLD